MLDEEVAKAVAQNIKPWEGELKMTNKPRIKNKNGQMAAGAAAGAWLAGPVGAAAGAANGAHLWYWYILDLDVENFTSHSC